MTQCNINICLWLWNGINVWLMSKHSAIVSGYCDSFSCELTDSCCLLLYSACENSDVMMVGCSVLSVLSDDGIIMMTVSIDYVCIWWLLMINSLYWYNVLHWYVCWSYSVSNTLFILTDCGILGEISIHDDSWHCVKGKYSHSFILFIVMND